MCLPYSTDNGYPQFTEAKILSEFITVGAHQLETPKAPMAVTNAVSWRSEGLKYQKNEVGALGAGLYACTRAVLMLQGLYSCTRAVRMYKLLNAVDSTLSACKRRLLSSHLTLAPPEMR